MLQQHLKDSDHNIETEDEEVAVEQAYSALQKISDSLKQTQQSTIRHALAGKIYTVLEEDTEEEMEFVKTESMLQAFKIPDKSGLVKKLFGEYIRL